MSKIYVPQHTTAVDLSFNLSGSLTGFPVLLSQLPAGERIGFDTLPAIGEDVQDIGQTWTPDLSEKEIDIDVPVYNVLGTQKAPFTTNLQFIEKAIAWGEAEITKLEYLIND